MFLMSYTAHDLKRSNLIQKNGKTHKYTQCLSEFLGLFPYILITLHSVFKLNEK